MTLGKLYSASWCANCVTAKKFIESKGIPVVDKTSELALVGDHILYIDVDQFPEDAQAETIRSLPTFITETGERLVGSAKIIEYVNSQSN